MKTFATNYELKKEITTSFPNKEITSINGINLLGRNDLARIEVSNKHCTITTYTPFNGHKTEFIIAPFNVEFSN
jgi:hypothetical protein